ncbi:HAD family hydrolase [Pandoraea commovens]|uniref:HAD family hydrolase n=1 Tax=Pandoraea commovens TaxID=2508289 RepID=A0A5E4RIU5_9BURK|nr:HAD family hydrolase [Pandoraea commovens]UVA81861.1 haloacid dehalogenase-like hydrolase [Pandoraea commovens]VVD61838.1 HAD family hydrolase [Pandoraea commovens]
MERLRSRFGRAAAAVVVALSLAACATPTPTPPEQQAASPASSSAHTADALPSWRDGGAKQAIVRFVADVTRNGSASYVPPAERIAVFDNDGTLWSEQPLYFQFVFMIDQVKAQAAAHPEWKRNPAFQALMAGDLRELSAQKKSLLQLLAQANSGMNVADYDARIEAWLASAKHPTLHRPYTSLVFQPQLELLTYLRANGFKTYIVSGGTTQFMRAWVERVYGVPPEQVIGTDEGLKYESRDGQGQLVRQPKIDFVDDGPGKPVGIYRRIGRKPILAFGNSDGDLQMLEYTTTGQGPHLALLVHHDDATREFAYDRQSKIGRLDRAWDVAVTRGWTVVSMKDDWATVFPLSSQ